MKMHGQWWLPEDPSRVVAGVLTIGQYPFDQMEIRLFDELFDGHEQLYVQSGTGLAKPLNLIHGRSDGRAVTVLMGILSNIDSPAAEYSTVEFRYQPQAVVIGAHQPPNSNGFYRSTLVEIAHLTEFSQLTESGRFLREGEEEEYAGNFAKVVDDTKTKGPNYTLSLVQSISSKSPRTNNHFGERYELHIGVMAKYDFDENIDWTVCRSAPHPLRQLLTIATDSPCAIRNRWIETIDGKRCAFYVDSPVADSPVRPADARKYAFTLADCEFGQVYPKWLELRSRTGAGVNILDSLISDRPSVYQSAIMTAMMAAEDFHRRLGSDTKASEIDQRNYDEVIKACKPFLTEEQREFFSRAFQRPGVSFKHRLLELTTMPDAEAVSKLLGDIESWAATASTARNSVAHAQLNKLDKLPLSARLRLADLTKELLRLVCMDKLGLEESVQRRFISASHAIRVEHFHEVGPT